MSRRQHSIQVIGGQTKTLKEWRVLSCVTTHRLGGEDSMDLVIAVDVDEACPFAPFARLRLLDPNGAARFVGRVMIPHRHTSAGEHTLNLTVVGAWSYLASDTYQQGAYFAADPAVEEPVTGIVPVGRVILNRNPVNGTPWTIAQQIGAALAYSVAEGAPIEYSTARIPAVIAPEDQALDLRVSDVIRRCLQWAPHIGCRWKYSGDKPELIFDDTIDPDGGFAEREIDLDEIDGGERYGRALEGRPRYDLLCPEFKIVYIYETQIGNVRWNALHEDASTAAPSSIAADAYGRQISTIVLRGSVWDGESYTAPEERPPDGLAATMHKAFKSLFYELQWSQTGTEVDWTPGPGDIFSVSGTADFADARSVCQEIVRDIQTGRSIFKCGPPTYLGLDDRLALLEANRIRGQSHAAGENTYGFKDRRQGEGGELAGYVETPIRVIEIAEGSLSPVIKIAPLKDPPSGP